jgi:hypothetical protein
VAEPSGAGPLSQVRSMTPARKSPPASTRRTSRLWSVFTPGVLI